MRNNLAFAFSALLIIFGASACEKYKSDNYDVSSGRTNNYITIPAALQTDTVEFAQGDTIQFDGATALLSSRVSFPDALTATLVLDADAPGISDVTYTETLAPQLNNWFPTLVIPENYLPTGLDSTYATLRLTSVSGPVSGQLKIGYQPTDAAATIPLLIRR